MFCFSPSFQVIYARLGEELCYVGGRPDGEGVVNAFLTLFETFPESRGLFQKFRHLPIEKLR